MAISGAAVFNIVMAGVAITGSIVSGILTRKAMSNAGPEPDRGKHPSADEGAAAAWLFGSRNRVTGQLIYMSKINRIPISATSKGKSAQAVGGWNYKVDVGIAWCRNEVDDGGLDPVENYPINKLWASGQLIYAREYVVVAVIPSVTWQPYQRWDKTFRGDFNVNSDYCEPGIQPQQRLQQSLCNLLISVTIGDSVDQDFLLVASRIQYTPVTVTGSFQAENNGTFSAHSLLRTDHPSNPLLARWWLKLNRGSYLYPPTGTPDQICTPSVQDPGEFQAGTDVPGLQISFTVTNASMYFPPGFMETYPGSDFQDVDPVIQADMGINHTPAFRGTCYTRIRQLEITKWGSMVPQFEAEIRVNDTQQFIRAAFDAVLARNEATTAYHVDTSLINAGDGPVFGLAVLGPTPPIDTLKMLMQVYDIEAQERLVQLGTNILPESVMFFVPRNDLPVLEVDYDLTSAREVGDDGTVHAMVKRGSRDTLPQEFILEYIEIERDLQPGTTSASVATGGVRNTQKMSIPMALTQPGGDLIAKKLLWKAINFHDKVDFTLPPNNYGITEGDRMQLNTPANGLPIVCRVAQIDIGENGLLEIKADIDDDLIYEQFTDGGYTPEDDTQPVLPQAALTLIMDIAPLSAAHATQFGIYLATEVWEIIGSTTYSYFYSLDKINWSNPIAMPESAISGTAITILGPPDEVHAWDMVNTVQINMQSASTLESVSQEEVEQGLNWAVLGGEVIGFMTATLTPLADYQVVYTLSGLLRGRNDTEAQAIEHFEDAQFVLLPPSSQAVAFIPLEPATFAVPLFITVVPTGLEIIEDEIVQFTPHAETLRPYSVHATWGIKRPNGDICIFATPRTRVPFRLLSELIPPFVEVGPASDFTADVYYEVGNTWVYLRTVEACDAQYDDQLAFQYDATMQDEDLNQSGLLSPPYLTLGFRFVIKRTSDTIGDGRTVEFCIFTVGVEYDGTNCTLAS